LKQAQAEARKKAAEEAATQKKAEAEARKLAAQQAAEAKKAEAETRKQAAAEAAAQKKAEAEARKAEAIAMAKAAGRSCRIEKSRRRGTQAGLRNKLPRKRRPKLKHGSKLPWKRLQSRSGSGSTQACRATSGCGKEG